jgi:uncharacterized membrane protein
MTSWCIGDITNLIELLVLREKRLEFSPQSRQYSGRYKPWICPVNSTRSGTMLKTFLGLIVLSILVILFKSQFADVLHWVASLHAILSDKFVLLFSGSSAGLLIAHVLSLVIIPIVIALIPAFIYWLIYRTEMPHWLVIVWIVWVMLATIIGLG